MSKNGRQTNFHAFPAKRRVGTDGSCKSARRCRTSSRINFDGRIFKGNNKERLSISAASQSGPLGMIIFSYVTFITATSAEPLASVISADAFVIPFVTQCVEDNNTSPWMMTSEVMVKFY